MNFNAACIQLNNQAVPEDNLRMLEQLIRDACSAGADIVFTPENTDFIYSRELKYDPELLTYENHKVLAFLKNLSKELGVWINIGSISMKDSNYEKFANRSFTIDNNGKIVSFYDKIHLFDSNSENLETYRESVRFSSGRSSVTTDIPWGKLGHTICYDLRFPHLYRRLALSGAHFISVPAAFLSITGKAHWHILLRARAIETGCYIIAAAQTGQHGKRKSYGHSLIIDPWGKILADAGTAVGFINTEIDTDLVEKTRDAIPSLYHNPDFE